MTLTLELTPEQEKRLETGAATHGFDTNSYVLYLLFRESPPPNEGVSLAKRLAQHGVLGAIEGTPRADGRSWSEIEAATGTPSTEPNKREPRILGFAKDIVGEFDLQEFNSVTPEEMGFAEYMP
jgi:hypothetical protein